KNVKLAIPAIKSAAGSEYNLNVFAYTKSATELVAAGHEIAREQIMLSGDYFSQAPAKNVKLEVSKSQRKISFKSGNVLAEFDVEQGRVSKFTNTDNYHFVKDLPEPYFWRAPTDNDFGNQM